MTDTPLDQLSSMYPHPGMLNNSLLELSWRTLQEGARLVHEVGQDAQRLVGDPLEKLGNVADVVVGGAARSLYRNGDIPLKVLGFGGEAMWGAINMPADLLSPSIMHLYNPQAPRGSRSLFVYKLKQRLKIPIKPKLYPAKQSEIFLASSLNPDGVKNIGAFVLVKPEYQHLMPNGTITFATPQSELVHVTNSHTRKTLVISHKWLEPAVEKLGDFQTRKYQQGDIEIEGRKYSGEISAVFANGQVLFSYLDQTQTRQNILLPMDRISNIENFYKN